MLHHTTTQTPTPQDCDHGLVTRHVSGNLLTTSCWDCGVELGIEALTFEQDGIAACGHPAQNGVECRACALERWRASR